MSDRVLPVLQGREEEHRRPETEKRHNLTCRPSFFLGVSCSQDLLSNNPIAQMKHSLASQGGRRGHDQTSLLLFGADLSLLPPVLRMSDSGTPGARLMASSFPSCPMVSPFPYRGCTFYIPELKGRISSPLSTIRATLQKEEGGADIKNSPGLAACST